MTIERRMQEKKKRNCRRDPDRTTRIPTTDCKTVAQRAKLSSSSFMARSGQLILSRSPSAIYLAKDGGPVGTGIGKSADTGWPTDSKIPIVRHAAKSAFFINPPSEMTRLSRAN